MSRRLPRLGALERWRAEIAAGTRQNTGACYDDLAAAACWEFRALEVAAGGDGTGADPRLARDYLDLALLRLHGHRVEPGDVHSARVKGLLRSLRGEARAVEHRRRLTWLERNAARAGEYVA